LLEAIKNGPKLKKTKPAVENSGDASGDAGGSASSGGGPQNAGGNEYGDGELNYGHCQSEGTFSQHAVLIRCCSRLCCVYCCAVAGQLLMESGKTSHRQLI
jgi:hypothetical protein